MRIKTPTLRLVVGIDLDHTYTMWYRACLDIILSNILGESDDGTDDGGINTGGYWW